MEAPYGSWKSPITGDLIVSEAVRFSGVTEMDGAVYWAELRPAEKGRTTLLRRLKDGSVEELLPAPYNGRTKVHEYGGGSFLITPKALYFSNFQDQQIYVRDGSGAIRPLTHVPNARFTDGCYDPSRDLLFYVMETHEGKKVENCIAKIDVKTGAVQPIAEGYDFYSTPRLSPDGRSLSYFCWNLPYMPWDQSELFVAKVGRDGTLSETKRVAGGKDESICRPCWGPDGLLYFVSDRSGWWNLYRVQKEKVEALCPMEAEFGFPQWVFGQVRYGFWGKDQIVASYSQNGYDHLGLKDRKLRPLDIPFNVIQSLCVSGDTLYFIGGSSSIPLCLVQYDLKKGTWQILKKTQEGSVPDDFISIPQAIEFPTEQGLSAYAFYYAPKNPRYSGLKGELPPLLVLSHGGPTSQAIPSYNLSIQYWTSRGIGVIDVNYGGSSGYGRAYRNRLKGNWGVVDVDDCVNAALYCARKKLADPARLAIMGGSAGGFTTLAALAFRHVFHVGASLFGVSDLEALNLDTHKFESRYNDQLVGPYPEARDLYIERSPIYHVDQIECPVILLQGAEDEIVPPAQSEKMYESLLKRGIPTAYILFKGEQHGFRQAANIKRSIEATAYFFSKILGFSLADPVEPVKIENFPEK
jgi:dipeptidyl aminopeptidase/acylaminoacyl peptidase